MYLFANEFKFIFFLFNLIYIFLHFFYEFKKKVSDVTLKKKLYPSPKKTNLGIKNNLNFLSRHHLNSGLAYVCLLLNHFFKFACSREKIRCYPLTKNTICPKLGLKNTPAKYNCKSAVMIAKYNCKSAFMIAKYNCKSTVMIAKYDKNLFNFFGTRCTL